MRVRAKLLAWVTRQSTTHARSHCYQFLPGKTGRLRVQTRVEYRTGADGQFEAKDRYRKSFPYRECAPNRHGGSNSSPTPRSRSESAPSSGESGTSVSWAARPWLTADTSTQSPAMPQRIPMLWRMSATHPQRRSRKLLLRRSSRMPKKSLIPPSAKAALVSDTSAAVSASHPCPSGYQWAGPFVRSRSSTLRTARSLKRHQFGHSSAPPPLVSAPPGRVG